jgi:type II secretory pathway pseudopilin PulG
MTLVELAIVLAVIGALTLMATFGVGDWMSDQRLKSAVRAVSDAFQIARAESIRTGNPHLVIFANALGATAPIQITNDGAIATANCTIDVGEVAHSVAAEPGVAWGTTPALAGATLAPDDTGSAPASSATGSTFTDATLSAAGAATWVLFQPDGMPRVFTPNAGACDEIGLPGQGGGAIYLTNGRRDYAVVLSALGTSRVHAWNPDQGAWRQ